MDDNPKETLTRLLVKQNSIIARLQENFMITAKIQDEDEVIFVCIS